MRKILVIGCCGSGKSTFSRALAEKTGLPLYSLDKIWWKPDRTHISREEFDLRLGEVLSLDEWIIDGEYSRTLERRIAACDSVFFLDYPTEVCLRGIEERIGKPRDDMPWVETSMDPELKALVLGFSATQRPEILRLRERYPEKRWIVFRSREESAVYINSI